MWGGRITHTENGRPHSILLMPTCIHTFTQSRRQGLRQAMREQLEELVHRKIGKLHLNPTAISVLGC